MAKYSIIITVYNKEKILPRCFHSVANQTCENIQIILVDDGSVDNSLALCKEYEKQDDRVLVVHQENQGVAMARNAGLSAATGEYVTFIDADDYMDLTVFSTVEKILEKSPNVDMVSWGCIEEVGEKMVAEITMENKIFESKKDAFISINSRLLGYVWLWAFRRELLLKNSITFDSYLEPIDDYYFVLQSFAAAGKIASVSNAYYHYVRSSSLDSLSKKLPEHVFLQHKKIGLYKAGLFRQLNLSEQYIAQEMKLAAYAMLKNGIKRLFRDNIPFKLLHIYKMTKDTFIVDNLYNNTAEINLKKSEIPRYNAIINAKYFTIYRMFDQYEKEKKEKAQ